MDPGVGRETMRRFYDAFNRHDLGGMGACMADDVVAHHLDEFGLGQGRDAFVAYYKMILAGLPDLRFELLDVVAEGDRVAARARMLATHEGELMGIPASGHRVELEGVDFVRVDHVGRFVEYWGYHDNLAFMQQLGAIPADATG
jgi:steroid delta-isomerase-like uncharacterized protein